MSKIRDLGHRLYAGEVSYDFIGHYKRWFTISAVILLITLGALIFRGLNLGIEFSGGAEFQVPKSSCSVEEVRNITEDEIGGQAIVTELGDGSIRIQTSDVTPEQGNQVTVALEDVCDVEATDINIRIIGPTWGSDISKKALQGMVVFLVLVSIFLALYFEWKMAIAALVALAHDLIITIGVYAILGFEVTPATAIGLLTILGYSLYDTVVVFDKVKENTKGISGQSRLTYSEAANLAINQTVMRSINTSIVALLPVGAILFVGAGLLGAGTLKDLALALFVGMAAGTYSSIFVATPILAQLKEREPEMQALEQRVYARRKNAQPPSTASTANATSGATAAGENKVKLLDSRTVNETGERNQPKKQARSKRRNVNRGDGPV
jgi:preprotein translocase subunit SecF